ncbi:hypothetical protein AC482_06055 [miscellaneous Crenarchaeota group-15 archaeon DG-45]|uniref:Cation/H+ exchanger transmembrane domain-containing protein n=1 Tax=miscellaneous Crenarchaeota group-15 archaeon DG-45 TaxID=1685127 RepID=A0A0M0BM19_9ARCH|nr:MAG: hypothetical protein AC482_06055 [miscellaneous Crenarchaeota group-15 archaeon DG-45]
MEPDILYRALVDLCLLLFLAHLAAEVASRVGAPKVLGVLAAGVIFGPSMVGGISVGGRPFIEFNELIHVFADIGAVLILFTAGLEVPFDEFRNVGLCSFVTGISNILFSFVLVFGATVLMGFSGAVGVLAASALLSTSDVFPLHTLRELGKTDTLEARVILSASVYDDIFATALLAVILTAAGRGSTLTPLHVAENVAFSIILWFLILLLGVVLIPRLIERAEGLGAGIVESMAVLVCFGMATITGAVGLSPLVGAFSAGMAIASSRSLRKVRSFIAEIELVFIPLFFVVIGAGIDPSALLSGNLALILVFTVIAVLSKIIGCMVPASYLLRDPRTGLRVGLGMISRGEIGFIIASIGLTSGILTGGLYTALVAVTCITIVITPLLLRRSYEAEGLMEKLDRLYDRLSKLRPEPVLRRLRR